MSTTSNDSVHGHYVIDLVDFSTPKLTRDTLRKSVEGEYGKDVRFHTCSLSGLTYDELVGFLLQHGKITEDAQGLLHAGNHKCSHG